jgi:MbtH protein
MAADEDADDTIYRVVVNDEEQYSIWIAERELPPGWRDVGKVGTKASCLAHIGELWTDMRPLSLRAHMARFQAVESWRPEAPSSGEPERTMDSRSATGDE